MELTRALCCKQDEQVQVHLPFGFPLHDKILEVSKVNELNQVDATYLTNARQVAKLELDWSIPT